MEIKGEFRFLTALTFKVYAGDNYQLFKIEVIFLSLSETYGGGGYAITARHSLTGGKAVLTLVTSPGSWSFLPLSKISPTETLK